MTTAHRPTWKAAVGRGEEGGWTAGGSKSTLKSHLDNPAHTKLKFRSITAEPLAKAELKQKLLALERAEDSFALKLPKRPQDSDEVKDRALQKLLLQTADVDERALQNTYNDSDVECNSSSSESDLDASDNEQNDNDDTSSSDDDDQDEEAALQAELLKIRAEREAANKKAQAASNAQDEAKQEEAALLGNPLLVAATSLNSKRRRWNDDIVFRNQAKGEPVLKKRFINDTVRNDFHKRFLNKFMK
jgi:protein CWC15